MTKDILMKFTYKFFMKKRIEFFIAKGRMAPVMGRMADPGITVGHFGESDLLRSIGDTIFQIAEANHFTGFIEPGDLKGNSQTFPIGVLTTEVFRLV